MKWAGDWKRITMMVGGANRGGVATKIHQLFASSRPFVDVHEWSWCALARCAGLPCHCPSYAWLEPPFGRIDSSCWSRGSGTDQIPPFLRAEKEQTNDDEKNSARGVDCRSRHEVSLQPSAKGALLERSMVPSRSDKPRLRRGGTKSRSIYMQ